MVLEHSVEENPIPQQSEKVGKLSKDGIDLLESLDNWSWDLDKKIKKRRLKEHSIFIERKSWLNLKDGI